MNKEGGLTRPELLEGVDGKEGSDFLQGGLGKKEGGGVFDGGGGGGVDTLMHTMDNFYENKMISK